MTGIPGGPCFRITWVPGSDSLLEAVSKVVDMRRCHAGLVYPVGPGIYWKYESKERYRVGACPGPACPLVSGARYDVKRLLR